jgi:glycosyltransferase involved in cell wall biosynthesis
MKVILAESHNLNRPAPLGSHHYIRLFREAGHRCLWLGPAVSPLHIFKADDLNRQRFKLWRKGLQEVDGIEWLVPLTLLFYYNLPLLRSLYAGKNQYRFCLPPLKDQLAETGFLPADLLWCAGPAAFSLLDLLPHRLSIYRLADRLDQFKMIPPNVGKLQAELIKKVDLVLATSRSLYEWAGKFRSDNLYYLPNGVSRIFFEPAAEAPLDFPGNGQAVVVYAGTLDSRFDLETVVFAVEKVQELHFLLIGPLADENLHAGLKSLQERENFTWLGPKQYDQLPPYLQAAAAGMIPFQLNELTEAVNPIKYYEYLASGLPVVAPPLRELVETKGPLYAYRSKEEFCSLLSEAVREKDHLQAGLRKFAAAHTWQRRFENIQEIIGSRIDE